MGRRTYYDILEISRRASDDEVKRAFRAQARKYHPDQNPGDAEAEELFKAALEAYRVLSDPALRRTYDRFGIAPSGAAFGGLAVSGGPNLADSLKGFAKAAARRLRARRGADITLNVALEFLDAVVGTSRVFELPRRGPDGRVQPRRLEFDLPPGLHHGQVLRWPGEGTPGTDGGRSGDLLVVLSVAGHPVLVRRGPHVVVELPLTLGEMAHGATIEVPTVRGRRRLTVPAGTQPGAHLRLAGLGVPLDVPGDAIFEVRLRFPEMSHPGLTEALQGAYAQTGTRTAAFDACLLESMAWDD